MSSRHAAGCLRASVADKRAAQPLPVAAYLEARQRERERLSQILHDNVAGGLTAAGLTLDLLSLDVPPEFQPRIAEIQQIIERSFDSVRELSREFHPDPAVRFRLAPALTMAGRRFADRFTGRFELLIDADPEAPEVSPAEARACYAVADAALDNVLRHAKATQASLSWSHRPGTFGTLTVQDNGRGFHPPSTPSGSGMTIMLYYVEIVGLELVVQSAVGSGTRIEMVGRGTRREPSGSPGPSSRED